LMDQSSIIRTLVGPSSSDEACLDVAAGVMRAVREIRGEPITDRPQALRTGAGTLSPAVRVYCGYFSGQHEECHFVNLTNPSPTRTIEVTPRLV
jgi:hypothetical protein